MPATSANPAAAAADRLSRWRAGWPSRLIDRLTAFLPLLLMALLALSTWWLVKSTPSIDERRAAAPLRHVPDYTMAHFTVQRFDRDGALRAEIEGVEARHYPDDDSLEIDDARIRSVTLDGHVTVATARLAITNGARTEVQLRGGAHVVREGLGNEAPLDFTGEFLQAYLETERVTSHLPVVVKRGATRIDADTMDYDNVERIVKVKGRVHATFASRNASTAAATGRGSHSARNPRSAGEPASGSAASPDARRAEKSAR